MNISFFVCDCIKTSSKYKIVILLCMSGQKILLMKAEKLLVLWICQGIIC